VLTLLADTVDKPEEIASSKVSDDEVALLEAELEQLSLYEPEWEVLSQKVARLQALRTLAHSGTFKISIYRWNGTALLLSAFDATSVERRTA
jgi:hypothetical protein